MSEEEFAELTEIAKQNAVGWHHPGGGGTRAPYLSDEDATVDYMWRKLIAERTEADTLRANDCTNLRENNVCPLQDPMDTLRAENLRLREVVEAARGVQRGGRRFGPRKEWSALRTALANIDTQEEA
jgi:hypothetical protein